MNHYCYQCGAPAVPCGTGIFMLGGMKYESFYCNLCQKGFKVVEGRP